MRRICIILALLFALVLPGSVHADAPIILLGSTVNLPEGLSQAVIATLQTNRPNDTPYYVITYIQAESSSVWLVCVAATSVDNPTDFDISENLLWAGTLRITQSVAGQWQGEYVTAGRPHAPKMAALSSIDSLGTGGGAFVKFPIQPGANAMYGISGVHGQGEYGSSGVVFVDLLGGSNMGSNVMSDRAYASATGVVDYLCKDDMNVAMRVDSGSGEVYYYVHLLNNSNLTLGHSFSVGSLLGSLKHGTFTGSDPVRCGAANQQETTYHVHWGFVPKNGQFQANKWILNVSKQTWSDGTTTVRAGQMLSNPGTYVPPGETAPDDTSIGAGNIVSFWDLIIAGLYAIAGAIVSVLPQHTSSTIFIAMVTGIGVTLRIIYTIADTVLNLSVLWAVLILILILEGMRLLVTILRFIKKYIPMVA
jgi:hypothetical protein